VVLAVAVVAVILAPRGNVERASFKRSIAQLRLS
jgi:hypothetical protein